MKEGECCDVLLVTSGFIEFNPAQVKRIDVWVTVE